MFKQAKAWGFIPENPMGGLSAPSAKNNETPHYSVEELASFWQFFPQQHLRRALLIHAAWTMGLRREELLGLRWCDMDFDALTVTIQNCRIYIPGQGVIEKGSKNGELRIVGICRQVAGMFQQYRSEYDQYKESFKRGWLGQDLVFVRLAEQGKPYNPSTIDHWLDEFLKDNNLPRITLHGFRHTMGSLLHEAGMDIISISVLLGHKTKQANFLGGYGSAPRVTRTYLHKSKDAASKMTQLMADIFDKVMCLAAESSHASSHRA